jgi:hypothetical protein
MRKTFVTFILTITICLLQRQIIVAQTTSFDKDKPFEIINSKRGITTQSSETDTAKCKGWTISQTDLPRIIKACKPISGEDWHHLFEVWPCIISGQLKQNGNTYKFEINGGSWMRITLDGKSILLGNFKKENEKFFISNAWDGN